MIRIPKISRQFLKRVVSSTMAALVTVAGLPAQFVLAETSAAERKGQNIQVRKPTEASGAPRRIAARKPKEQAVPVKLSFGNAPSDEDIFSCHIFLEPLVPMDGIGSSIENKELANALIAFQDRKDKEDLSALTKFITAHPQSRWRAALEFNIGKQYFDLGYISQALKYWESSWNLSKNKTKVLPKSVADSAVSYLLLLEARLGRMSLLEKHLAEIKNRTLAGSAEQRVKGARDGLWAMQHHQEASFKCGPYAILSLARLKFGQNRNENLAAFEKQHSTQKGTNLAQLLDWSKAAGLNYKLAKRSPGAKFIVPCLAHLSTDHFVAITAEDKGTYKIQDSTFDVDASRWVSTRVLESETDGYFLVPYDKLPATGWSELSRENASKVWGKGIIPTADGGCSGFPKTCMGSSCSGGKPPKKCTPLECPTGDCMAYPSSYSMNATLNIVDRPLLDHPPIGPDTSIGCNYNYGEGNQPSTFDFTNLGKNWNLNWVSYLTITTVGSQRTIIVRPRTGGYETYSGTSTSSFPPNMMTLTSLEEITSGGSPIRWERRFPDGSIETFARPNAGSDTWFLTSVSDAQGNTASITYGSNTVGNNQYYRIASITDACGNSPTTFTYASATSSDPGYYKPATITDGFGRSCSFEYDSTNMQLLSITDAVGIKSRFAYDSDTDSTFINALTTPYGTTKFEKYTPVGSYVYAPTGLKFTFPDGSSSQIENWLGATKESYFWDREALAMYPNDPANHDYSHCQTTRWLSSNDPSRESPLINWTRKPLEAPMVYWYPNEFSQNETGTGTINMPTKRAQQFSPIKTTVTVNSASTGAVLKIKLKDAALPLSNGDASETFSYTVQSGDSTTVCAAGLAAAVNADPIFQGFGITATSSSNVVTITSQTTNNFDSTNYNNDSTGTQSISFGNGSSNRVEELALSGTLTATDVYSVIITDSGLPSGSKTVSYTAQTGDNFATIAQQLSVAANADTDLQTQGISAVWSTGMYTQMNQEPANNAAPVIAFKSDSANTTTYAGKVNGSSSMNWNQSTSAHGLVAASSYAYNSLGHVTRSIDPLGRFFDFTYDSNKIDLLKVLEREGINNLFMGTWEYTDSNAPHQPTVHYDSSSQRTLFTYDSGTGQLATITDTNGSVTTLSYDAAGYLTQIEGPLSGSNDVTTFTFYGYGPVHTVTDSEGYTITYAYDNLNRPTSVTYPDGSSEKTVYDKLDVVQQSDRLGRWSQFAYDSMDQLSYQIDALGRKTSYCWCDCGSIASITDPAKHTTKWHHDLEGRVIQKVYEDGSEVNYAYEPTTMRVKSIEDALGQISLFQYNLDDSVQVKRYTNAVHTTSQVSNTFDPQFSRMTSSKNGWGQLNYSYYPYKSSSILANRALVWIGGIPETPNATDTINLTFYSSLLGGGQYTLNYTVATGDAGQPDQVATHLATAINANGTLSGAGFNATATGAMVFVTGNDHQISIRGSGTGGTIATVGGAGRLAKVTNSVISNSQTDYGYDGLGRTTHRLINGGNNSNIWSFDEISRVTSEVDSLGTFTYAYIDNTSGSSKGVSRLASITYPNSQVSNFTWLPNIGDQRLQKISNLNPSAATLSQFDYAYNVAAEIKQWHQLQNSTHTHLGLGYDSASQLDTAVSDSGSTFKAYISGSVHAGDVVSVTAYDASLTGTTPVGQETASYTVQGGDTASSIASSLASQINSVMTSNIGVAGSASGSVITITTDPNHATQFTCAVTGAGATDTISLSESSPRGNLHKQLYYGYDCAGNRTGVEGDSSGTLGGGLTTAATKYTYNEVNELTGISAGGPIRFQGTTVNPIRSAHINVTQTATIGGSITAGNVVTISVHDAGLSQAENVSYTVTGGDSTTSIATALKNAINADTTLSGIGVTATSSAAVITVTSTSVNKTTYTGTVSAGATSTISLGGSLGANARISPTTAFAANPELDFGSNTTKVTAISGGGTAQTDSYNISISSVTGSTLQYDDNGNLTSDGTNTYDWDAENRLLQISYSGSGNNTQFVYDPMGRCAKIEERTSGSLTSTKQHLWGGSFRCEERDGSGSLSNGKQFFSLGQANFASGTPTNYFYTLDQLGSTREMTKTVSGTTTIEAQYGYDPYGQVTKLAGSQDADFQYAGYYVHARSGLNMPVYRAYNPSLGRFINRDPVEERGGHNLYRYVSNNPIRAIDPIGTMETIQGWALVTSHTYENFVEVERVHTAYIFPDKEHGLFACFDSCEKALGKLLDECQSHFCPNRPDWRANCFKAVQKAFKECNKTCIGKPTPPDGGTPIDGGEPPDNVIPFNPLRYLNKLKKAS